MATTRLDELFANNSASSSSRNELAQQLAMASSGGSTIFNASGVTASNSPTDVVGPSIQGSTFMEQMSSLTTQITNLTSIQQTQFGATQDNTQALIQNTVTKATGASSVGGALGNIASTVLGSGSILSPIVGGLLSLFGVGEERGESTAAPVPFILPGSVQYQSSLTGSYSGEGAATKGASGQSQTQVSPAPAQVNIQVNAMDSQSFLDHRDEIARAVKEALLTSNSLHDVISEL